MLKVGGHWAWVHDDPDSYGYYHTFDHLSFDGVFGRKIHILLPKNYALQPEIHFPVIYANDGQSFFWPPSPGAKTLAVAKQLSQLYQSKKIRRVIVVAVHSINRDREYSHAPWEIMRDYGDVDKYSKYLAKELKPFIDANYRTLPQARNTALVGSDLGGLAAIVTACLYPESFGIVSAHSPNVWAGLDDLYNLYPIVETLSSSLFFRLISPGLRDPNNRPRFWLDYGLRREGGAHNSLVEEAVTVRVRELIDLMKKKFNYQDKVELFTWEDPVGGHDELAWSYRFCLCMETLFPFVESEGRSEEEAWAKVRKMEEDAKLAKEKKSTTPTKTITTKSTPKTTTTSKDKSSDGKELNKKPEENGDLQAVDELADKMDKVKITK